jgi:flagellar hook assembly protein FlgD
VTFTYYLRNAITEKGKVKIVITDAAGNAVKELQAEGKAGINTVGWDLVGSKSHPLQTGDYTATLHAGDKELTQRVHVSIPDQQDAVTGDDLDTD